MGRLMRILAFCIPAWLALAGDGRAQQTFNTIMTARVEGGEKTPIWFAFAIEETCEVRRGFNMRVDRLPKHGEATIERSTRYVERWWLGRAPTREMRWNVANCIGQPVPVLQLYYTPNRGYSGFDDMQITITSFNRARVTHREIKLSVR